MMPVLLVTDGLLLLLFVSVCMFVLYVRKQPHLKYSWSSVAHKPIAMVAAIILLSYILVGLIDSIHFHPLLENNTDRETQIVEKRYSTDILSLLDVIVMHLRTESEKTYSAPFSAYAYTQETIESADPTIQREYPRLNYGGAHLADPEKQKITDILLKAVIGLIYGLMIWALVFTTISLISMWRTRQSLFKHTANLFTQSTDIPWRTIHSTLAVVITLATMFLYLSHYYHIFGTDKIGQDVFYTALKSIRTGLVIGTLTTLIMLPFATFMGLIAGYFGGRIDDLVQYLYTTLSSIPSVLLISATILMLQVYMSNHAQDFISLEQRADLRLFFLCLILGVTNWTTLCRILRGEALKLRESDYVQAAKALGVGEFRIILRHLLPNVMHIIMITIVLDFSGLVLAEAVLSYINIGVDPSMHSWGNMINSARLEMSREPIIWWQLLAAFIFMFVLILAANLLADTVRDAFDPRLRGAQ